MSHKIDYNYLELLNPWWLLDTSKNTDIDKKKNEEKKRSKERLIVPFLLAILIAFIPPRVAAPIGTSENATVEAANNWLGVKSVHGGNNTTAIDCSHLVCQVYS